MQKFCIYFQFDAYNTKHSMKHILLLFGYLICIPSFAQRIYAPDPSVNIPYLENEGESWVKLVAPGRKIKSVSWQEEKKRYNSYYCLDENGFLKEIKHNIQRSNGLFLKNRYEHKRFIYTNGKASKIEFLNKKGELTTHREYEYFTQYKVKSNRFYLKGKIKAEIINLYNSDSTISEHQSYKYKKGERNLIDRYEYIYYTGKQRKETRMYGKKNKLKQVWKYDCDFKGTPEVKKTNLVCRNTAIDNKGYETEVLFNTDHKGNKSKTVNVLYKVKGKTVIVRTEFFHIKKGKEQKWYDIHYPDSIEPWYEAHYYDKKGNKVTEWRNEYSTYNSKALIPHSKTFNTYHKGNITSSRVGLYDEKGLPISTESFAKKNRSLGKMSWTYSSDTLILLKNYGKTGRLKDTKRCTLQYY